MKAKAILDQRERVNRPKENGLLDVSVRIYYNRKYRYYSTGVELHPDDFTRVLDSRKQVRKDLRGTVVELNARLSKAELIIQDLKPFTFQSFENRYLDNNNHTAGVAGAFHSYIEHLRLEKRLSTADSYFYSLSSLENFKPKLEFADITPKFLKQYENWMLENNRSITTVGIYLRALRAIYNLQNIEAVLYPFGAGKYSIPRGRNIKKALTLDEVQKIYHYSPEPNTNQEMARDYWMFLYMCNGMNIKDFCFLKWSDINNDMISYQRAKTTRTIVDAKYIQVALKPQALDVINKWGVRSLDKNAFIFPHLSYEMNAEKQRKVYKQLTRVVNDNMKRIAVALQIDKEITTYYARHSFATILKRSGVGSEMISELLGHGDTRVTQNYLDGFEKEQIQQQTEVLIQGFNKVV